MRVNPSNGMHLPGSAAIEPDTGATLVAEGNIWSGIAKPGIDGDWLQVHDADVDKVAVTDPTDGGSVNLDFHVNAMESLIAQASRRCNIHRARYRGKAKTFLQHTLTAMAINLIRINAWLTGTTTTGCWTSRLTRTRNPTTAT